MSLKDFWLKSVIGKGAQGTVSLVVKKDTGKLYAMKMISKKDILAHNQLDNTMAERRILVSFPRVYEV